MYFHFIIFLEREKLRNFQLGPLFTVFSLGIDKVLPSGGAPAPPGASIAFPKKNLGQQ
jgi:hypothetical protein